MTECCSCDKLHLPEAQGALGNLIQNILENSFVKQPEFAYGAALAFMSTIVGRKVEYNRICPNLYIMNVGPSGCGKNAPQKCIQDWFIRLGADNLLGADDYASDASLVDSLELSPVRLDIMDEASGILKAITSSKNSYDSKMDELLCKLYTSSHTKFLGRKLANERRGSCIRPHVSILFSTTPTGLQEAITKKSLDKGLLGRFLIFSGDGMRESQLLEHFPEVDHDTFVKIKWWINYKAPESKQMVGQVNPDVLEMESSQEAKIRLREIFKEFDSLRRSTEQTSPILPIIARAYEQMSKIMIIHSCGMSDKKEPIINLVDVNFAYGMIKFYLDKLSNLVQDNIHENFIEKLRNKVLKTIGTSGDKGMSVAELNRSTRGLKKRDRDEIVRELIDSYEIIAEHKTLGGQPTLVYRRIG
jgi:hypothetical protein